MVPGTLFIVTTLDDYLYDDMACNRIVVCPCTNQTDARAGYKRDLHAIIHMGMPPLRSFMNENLIFMVPRLRIRCNNLLVWLLLYLRVCVTQTEVCFTSANSSNSP